VVIGMLNQTVSKFEIITGSKIVFLI